MSGLDKIPILKTNRLILRPFDLADAEVVQRLAGAKEVADTTLRIPHPYPDGAAKKWIESHHKNYDENKEVVFAITLKETDKLIGAIGLILNKHFNNAEIGYWIGVPFWNNGYATEAVSEILNYGFHKLQLNRIHAHYLKRNPSSGKVMIKNGMKEEGVLKQHVFHNGVYEDIVMCGIIKDDFN